MNAKTPCFAGDSLWMGRRFGGGFAYTGGSKSGPDQRELIEAHDHSPAKDK